MRSSLLLSIIAAFWVQTGSASSIVNTVPATSIILCNPIKSVTCAADPALATSIIDDFIEPSDNYLPYRTPSEIYYGDDGLTLKLEKRFDNPSLVSDFYIMFGKIEVILKSASGQGIISSFYLQSDDLDEIDLEWFGGDGSQMQSNYFSKGDTTTYDRGGYHNMADPRADFHNYTLDWNKDSLSWYIDGNLVRTLLSNDPSGYPQSPMRVYFGIWAGGDSTNSQGTIEWAGGLTDYSQVPFSMGIKSLIVSDYSSGSEYSYSDQSGSWNSINSLGGQINGRQAIANEEFDSLIGGNQLNVSNQSNGSSIISQQAFGSSSSTSSTSSTSSVSTTTQASIKSKTNSGTGKAISSIDAESKTSSFKSEFLSSATLKTTTSKSSKSIENTETSSKSKTASSSSSSSSVSSIPVKSSNAGNANNSQISLVVFFLFMLSLI
jgi:beta-glucanase (GH16 family)